MTQPRNGIQPNKGVRATTRPQATAERKKGFGDGACVGLLKVREYNIIRTSI